jgi:hypothetical protein
MADFVKSDLGLILFRRAIQIGFDRLTPQELETVVSYEEEQLRGLPDRPDGADRTARARLHLAIREVASKTLARRKVAA